VTDDDREPTRDAIAGATTRLVAVSEGETRPGSTALYGNERGRDLRSDTVKAQPQEGPSALSTMPAGGQAVDRTDSRIITDRDRQLELQEHLSTVRRLRRLLPLAVALWLGFFFVDFVLSTWVVPGELWPYLVLRLFGVLPLLGVWWRLRRRPAPSPRQLAALDILMTATCAGILAAMCLLSGGLTSPFATYIAMVIAGRAAVWPNPWRVGAVRLGVAAVASPAVMLLALPFSGALAAQLSDPKALATYFFFLMLIVGAWILLVIGSHNAWALRRQVFRTRSIGRYRLDRRIGRGGMGEVWVAWHDQLQRHVALKILRPDAGSEACSVVRFEREILSTAALTHPNTVRIYDHGVTEDGLWYYAMELLHGEDLQRAVARDGPMDPRRAVRLVRQAAGALAEAHRSGIVHRDVKPENLFIAQLGGEPNVVKVLDFGIARMSQADDDTRLTSAGWVAGTPAYLSPEAAQGNEVEGSGDVYGLGAVLYFLLTGTPPFSAANSMRLLRLHTHAPVERPSARLGGPVPAAVEALVLRCLEKDPRDRFTDAGALAAALDGLRWDA